MSAELAEERALLDAEWAKLKAEKEKFEAERNESGVEVKLFVGNLDESTTEEEIREVFAPFGALKEVIMLRSKDGKSKRSCFVKYYSQSDADASINAINNKVHDKGQESAMVVRSAKEGKPALRNSAYQMQGWGGQAAGGYGGYAQGYAAPAAGGYAAPGAYAGQAQGGYAAPAARGYNQGAGAMYAHGVARGGAANGSGGGGGGGRGPAGANLYVNNLAPNTSEEDVRAMFQDFGNVLSVKCFTGYGFVSFDTAQSASSAIQCLNGLTTMGTGRPLEVKLKQDKSSSAAGRYAPY